MGSHSSERTEKRQPAFREIAARRQREIVQHIQHCIQMRKSHHAPLEARPSLFPGIERREGCAGNLVVSVQQPIRERQEFASSGAAQRRKLQGETNKQERRVAGKSQSWDNPARHIHGQG